MNLLRLIPLLALLIAGCSQTAVLYVPPAAHLPLLSSAGQTDLSVLGGFYGVDARAAWSPAEHLEIFGLGSFHDALADSASHTFHAYQEFGTGWYTCLGTSTTFSVLAGYGWGRAAGYAREFSLEERSPAYEVTGRYSRPFAGIGVGFSGRVDTTAIIAYREYGLTLRVVRVGLSTAGEPAGPGRGSGWYLEPVFVGRMGDRAAQLEYQAGFSTAFQSSGIESTGLSLSIGVHLQLDRLF